MDSFAIFYADGSIVEGSTYEDWLAAPVDGIQAVVAEDPEVGRRVLSGKDFYYCFEKGGFYQTDDLGAHLRAYYPQIKHGLCVSRERWQELHQIIKDYDAIPIR